MTKEWYKFHGYQVSINIDQSAIDRAERDVMAAYVLPILPTADTENEDVAHCVADLAYLLLLQRSIHLTRSGAKEKTSPNSTTPDGWRVLEEGALTASLSIDRLRAMYGASADAAVKDICKIYFTTNFLHT